jgi:hypothetical protein
VQLKTGAHSTFDDVYVFHQVGDLQLAPLVALQQLLQP